MARFDYRPWACAPLCAVVLAYVGCSTNPAGPAGSTPAPVSSASAASPESAAPAAPQQAAVGSRSKPDNILSSLGQPAAILLITGQQDGYLEPCGCSEDQEGGLIRRSDLFDRIQKRNWPTARIDLGSLIKDPTGARGGFDQAKIKFDHAIKALKLLDYSALALSAEDLKVGVGEALSLFDNGLGNKTKIVVANVDPEAVFAKLFQHSLVVTAGPVKLGITAVIDPESLQKLSDPDKDALLPVIKSPDAVLPGVLTELEGKSDYQVLMVQGTPELAHSLAKAHPGFDIVVSTSQADDVLNPEPEMLNDGKTMLVTVGKKGKCVGLVSFYPQETPRERFRLVTLNKYFGDPAKPMKSLIQDEYRGMLKAADIVLNFVRTGSAGATFVGAQSCKECHPNTYQFWSTTKHAHAFQALKDDPKPNTIFDAECISCHTTGFPYNSGWRSEATTPLLAGNQCENCHGPGSSHVADPVNADARKLIALSAERANKNGLCERCHDAENSRHFDFSQYWGKIVHKGLDDYKDPKVRRGLSPQLSQPKAVEKPR
jgi:Cytochrome c554 and c-prime